MESLFDMLLQLAENPGEALRWGGIYLILAVAGALFVTLPLVAYYLFSLPLRRTQRARLFVDVLEQGFDSGRSLEQILVEVAGTRDRALGRRFVVVGERIHRGMPWALALRSVPNFLPEAIVSTLEAGARIGDVRKVLPLCKGMLSDAASQSRAAYHVVGGAPWILCGLSPQIVFTLGVFVMPKYNDIMKDMGAIPENGGLRSTLFVVVFVLQIVMTLSLLGFGFLYVGSPWIRRYLQPKGLPFMDWFALRIAWCRHRILRDFGRLLALALDSGLPEAEAVQMAAQGTGNRMVLRRAGAVVDALSQGVSLEAACTRLLSGPELSWRLGLAARSKGGFHAALCSWWESLEMRAHRQQETASQIAASALVLVSGVSIGSLCFSLLLPIVRIIEQTLLW